MIELLYVVWEMLKAMLYSAFQFIPLVFTMGKIRKIAIAEVLNVSLGVVIVVGILFSIGMFMYKIIKKQIR